MKNKEVKALTALRLLQSGENPSSEDQGVSAMGVSRLSEGGEDKSQVGDFTVGMFFIIKGVCQLKKRCLSLCLASFEGQIVQLITYETKVGIWRVCVRPCHR